VKRRKKHSPISRRQSHFFWKTPPHPNLKAVSARNLGSPNSKPSMPPRRKFSGIEICRLLEAHGFQQVRQRGSHRIMQIRTSGTTRTVPVPLHKISSPELLLPSSGNPAWKNRYLSKEPRTAAQCLPFLILNPRKEYGEPRADDTNRIRPVSCANRPESIFLSRFNTASAASGYGCIAGSKPPKISGQAQERMAWRNLRAGSGNIPSPHPA